MEADRKRAPRICFICGVRRRTGTNFLYQLLYKHPGCAHVGEIEDFLLHHGDLLESFAGRAFLVWNDDLEYQGHEAKGEMLRSMGRGLESFLVGKSEPYWPSGAVPRVICAKTPSAVGLERFPRLFPNSRAIVLVRDGRAVVESAMKTWGWRVGFYEEASAWARSVRSVLKLPKSKEADWWLMVRYEDLVSDTENELRRIFGFLDLPEDEYDYGEIQRQAVIGSSQFRTKNTKANAVRLQAPADFAPLDRFAHWTPRRHRRFNWIAGAELRAFGYEVGDPGAGLRLSVYNHLLDAWGSILRWLRAALRGLRRRLGAA